MYSFHFRTSYGIAKTQSSSSSSRTNHHRRAISRPRKKKGKKRRRQEGKRTNQQPIKQASKAKQNGSSNGISGGNVHGGSAERYTRSVLDVENNYSTARSARSEKRSPLDPGSFHGLAFAV